MRRAQLAEHMYHNKAALLWHSDLNGGHFDLLLGAGLLCRTWRIELNAYGHPQFWQSHVPHRRRYLSYQGPVSRGRGRVRCHWRGAMMITQSDWGWQLMVGELGVVRLRTDGTVRATRFPRFWWSRPQAPRCG